jgi:hypothetical protein
MFPEPAALHPRPALSAKKWGPAEMHDVFIAMPMSTLPELDYRRARRLVLDLIQVLRGEFALERVYFAGRAIETQAQFSIGSDGMLDDLDALRRSRRFWLIYPEAVASSALIEVGYALRENLPIAIFVRKGIALPYLLKEAANAPAERQLAVSIVEYENDEALVELVRRRGPALLERAAIP